MRRGYVVCILLVVSWLIVTGVMIFFGEDKMVSQPQFNGYTTTEAFSTLSSKEVDREVNTLEERTSEENIQDEQEHGITPSDQVTPENKTSEETRSDENQLEKYLPDATPSDQGVSDTTLYEDDPDTSWPSPTVPPDAVKRGTIMVQRWGRLGNLMFQYASMWALAKKFDLHGAVLFPDMRDKLVNVFPGLSIHGSRDTEDGLISVDITEFLHNPDLYVPMAEDPGVFLPGYPEEVPLIHQYRNDIMKEFQFRPDLSEASQSILRDLGRNGTYVGVHIRRTDYAHHIEWQCKGKLIEAKYFQEAMSMMKQMLGVNITFAVTSDDREWAEENVIKPNSNDTFWVGDPDGNRREQDLCTLASCNHSIISLGTFGFWSAYLAGGMTIVPDKFCLEPYPLVEHLRVANISGWIFLDVNE